MRTSPGRQRRQRSVARSAPARAVDQRLAISSRTANNTVAAIARGHPSCCQGHQSA